MERWTWLVVADDLTGAADCAIAFAKAGLPTMVSWGEGAKTARSAVLSIDADSRRLGPQAAADRQSAVLAICGRPGQAFYKKIDSTLRGQPAAELAAQLACLTKMRGGAAPLAVVAPAFPQTGRTVEGGRVRLDGRALEETPLWARDHSYASASLPEILATAGLDAAVLPLALVRSGPAAVASFLAEARRKMVTAVVCDAATEADLAVIAAGSLPLADRLMWVGSGGLAGQLARLAAPPGGGDDAVFPGADGRPVLVVVGSVAEASRAQAEVLSASGLVCPLIVEADVLFAGPDAAAWRAVGSRLHEELAAGRDVLLEIAAAARPDLARGAELAARLARLVEPSAALIGGLVATGGDTACALLSHLGVGAIRLFDEVEAGVPIGITDGALAIPVVTKAGAFGDEQTLCRCVHALKQRVGSEP